jgi:hypothetical protein
VFTRHVVLLMDYCVVMSSCCYNAWFCGVTSCVCVLRCACMCVLGGSYASKLFIDVDVVDAVFDQLITNNFLFFFFIIS